MAYKTCGTCRQSKDLNKFYKDSSRKDGHAACCKPCRHERLYPEPKEGFFRCTVCGNEKPLDLFVKNRNDKRGHTNKCRECSAKNSRMATIRRKQRILNHYGNSCKCCNETTYEFLTIDHINNDGASHTKEIGRGTLYKWLIRNNFPEGFQTLCMNCNFAKGKYGKCPHQKETT